MNSVTVTAAPKAMKAMKAMETVSARLAKRPALASKPTKTGSGLAKGDLAKNKAWYKKAKAEYKKAGLGLTDREQSERQGDPVKNNKELYKKAVRRGVFASKTPKTSSGLTTADLVKNKHGKVVSKKKSAKAKKSPWIAACSSARKALHIKGFVGCKKGSAFYKKAKALYKK